MVVAAFWSSKDHAVTQRSFPESDLGVEDIHWLAVCELQCLVLATGPCHSLKSQACLQNIQWERVSYTLNRGTSWWEHSSGRRLGSSFSWWEHFSGRRLSSLFSWWAVVV